MTDKTKANVVKTLDRLIAFHSPLGNLSAPRVKPLITEAKRLGVFDMLAISPK